ncbi:MBOAT family O-acyltransferase [Ichthyenterobacterium sp. W332]|uniref:MBOAT family O-acyltransferase n=1 Tax=Microcosmobacter mediterraneus TaxID=3075607 RepID=A0ABU2YI29_9FLAO|nr:MBOAT family O-acyltransferase [Ichthyenterobacterium sp. W332]MDT0557354.1 MBOAT family O-acyltransferase [Ichthyenterobacterium sp. W332]
MLFNSLDFIVFLPIVFITYWLVIHKSLQYQNLFLVISSYVFYAWWDYRFLALIVLSTLVDFIVAKKINSQSQKSVAKKWLLLSVAVNLGLLGFFKYCNFFIESWVDAWEILGVDMQASTLNIILPVGISFYTFQTLSYTIDVYRKKIEPVSDVVQFAAFVSFFPQLVAGPIERAKNLLPQFGVSRVFNTKFALSGFYLIIWGLFKKVVVADNCAFFVNQIFENPELYSSVELLLGSILFAFQIYGDFSGYSDIAIGVARLFGFSLMVNFSFPYFSRDIAEFWRRWHISLSTWFRDYVYIPLGGSRGQKFNQFRNVMLVFLISGFWHGANWTFIVWGAIHALLFLPLMFTDTNRKYTKTTKMVVYNIPSILMTFILVCLAWVFFRADSMSIATNYLVQMFSFIDFSYDVFIKNSKSFLFSIICIISILIMLGFELVSVQNNQKEVRLKPYTAIFVILLITFMGVFKNPSNFIYFQF